MEIMSFILGIAAVLVVILVIAIIVGIVKIVKNGSKISDCKSDISNLYNSLEVEKKSLVDEIDSRFNCVHEAIDSLYKECKSYTDSRFDKVNKS